MTQRNHSAPSAGVPAVVSSPPSSPRNVSSPRSNVSSNNALRRRTSLNSQHTLWSSGDTTTAAGSSEENFSDDDDSHICCSPLQVCCWGGSGTTRSSSISSVLTSTEDEFIAFRSSTNLGIAFFNFVTTIWRLVTTMQGVGHGYGLLVPADVTVGIISFLILVGDIIRYTLFSLGKLSERRCRLMGHSLAVLTMWCLSGIPHRLEHRECWLLPENYKAREGVDTCLDFIQFSTLAFVLAPHLFPVRTAHIVFFFTIAVVSEVFFLLFLHPPEMSTTTEASRLLFLFLFALGQALTMRNRSLGERERFEQAVVLARRQAALHLKKLRITNLVMDLAPSQHLLQILQGEGIDAADKTKLCTVGIITVKDHVSWMVARLPVLSASLLDLGILFLEEERTALGLERLFLTGDTLVVAVGLRSGQTTKFLKEVNKKKKKHRDDEPPSPASVNEQAPRSTSSTQPSLMSTTTISSTSAKGQREGDEGERSGGASGRSPRYSAAHLDPPPGHPEEETPTTTPSRVSDSEGYSSSNDESTAPHDPSDLFYFMMRGLNYGRRRGIDYHAAIASGPCQGAVIASPRLSYLVHGKAFATAKEYLHYAQAHKVVCPQSTAHLCQKAKLICITVGPQQQHQDQNQNQPTPPTSPVGPPGTVDDNRTPTTPPTPIHQSSPTDIPHDCLWVARLTLPDGTFLRDGVEKISKTLKQNKRNSLSHQQNLRRSSNPTGGSRAADDLLLAEQRRRSSWQQQSHTFLLLPPGRGEETEPTAVNEAVADRLAEYRGKEGDKAQAVCDEVMEQRTALTNSKTLLCLNNSSRFWEVVSKRSHRLRHMAMANLFAIVVWILTTAALTSTLTVPGVVLLVAVVLLQLASVAIPTVMCDWILKILRSTRSRYEVQSRISLVNLTLQCILVLGAASSLEPSLVNRRPAYLYMALALVLLDTIDSTPWVTYIIQLCVLVIPYVLFNRAAIQANHEQLVALVVIVPILLIAAYLQEYHNRKFYLDSENVAAIAKVAEAEHRVHSALLESLMPPYIVPIVEEKRSGEWGCIAEALDDIAVLHIRFHVSTIEAMLNAAHLVAELATKKSDAVGLVSMDGDEVILGGPLERRQQSDSDDPKVQKALLSQLKYIDERHANIAAVAVTHILASLLQGLQMPKRHSTETTSTDKQEESFLSASSWSQTTSAPDDGGPAHDGSARQLTLTAVLHRGDGLASVMGVLQPRFAILGPVTNLTQAVLDASPRGFVCATEKFVRLLPTSTDDNGEETGPLCFTHNGKWRCRGNATTQIYGASKR